jgi:hypothetical protein
LQVFAELKVFPLHDAVPPHVVPVGASSQTPPAAHLPVLPQVPFEAH